MSKKEFLKKVHRKHMGFEICQICNEEFYQSPTMVKITPMLLTLCDKDECYEKASEYKNKRDQIMQDFSREKERLLRPWQSKLEADLFLLEKDYLKG